MYTQTHVYINLKKIGEDNGANIFMQTLPFYSCNDEEETHFHTLASTCGTQAVSMRVSHADNVSQETRVL